MARQAALLLAVHGYEIPNLPVDNDFYRQALDLELRGKKDIKEDVLAAMGGIGLKHFSRYKALLRLSDEAMELAYEMELTSANSAVSWQCLSTPTKNLFARLSLSI